MVKVNERCMLCAGCVGICPVDAITLYETGIYIDEKCIGCGACIRFCPVGALEE